MWMENENKKLRQEHERKDQGKFRELLSQAEKFDPRLRAESRRVAALNEQKKQEREEKERQQKAEDAAKRLKEGQKYLVAQQAEERARIERQAAERKRSEDRLQAIRSLKAMMKERSVNSTIVHPVDVESMIEKGSWTLEMIESFRKECDDLSTTEALESHMGSTVQTSTDEAKRKEQERMEQKKKATEAKRKENRDVSNWTQDELLLLTKAINKYPGGASDRWGAIATFIGTKTRADVLAKAQSLCQGKSLSALGSIVNTDTISKSKIKTVTTNAPDINYDKLNSVDPTTWTADQQKHLQAAMKEFPASMPAKERWVKIGAAVEGKTAKQCLDRFKEIKSKMTQQK